MTRALVFSALLLLPGAALQAQTERQTGFMAQQWSICTAEGVALINETASITTPILEALRSEGMIRAWYDVRHAWGDEWNVGFITIADSHRAWLDFWAEYWRRASAAAPEAMEAFGKHCTMHKDNFYSIRDSRTPGS
ncbi:MAG TPA: hypothetical protein VLA36_04935 [Longimicrobiales bacterium]|nr:hypothetical protein [Longimicrobiales bacterium]